LRYDAAKLEPELIPQGQPHNMSNQDQTHFIFQGTSARPAPYRGWFAEVSAWLCRAYMSMVGWKMRGDWPELPKVILLAAPHTSNWDGLLMLATAGAYRLKLKWMGKKSLVKGPFGGIMRALGVVPVDRDAKNGLVGSVSEAIARANDIILAIAPEGSRARVEEWKKGFYLIAHAAKVPIVFSVLDFKTKIVTISGWLMPSGDFDADWPLIRSHYAKAEGKYNQNFVLPA
jgi:1-acyl-sn-glycerol-3-phosphate acyltransferase